MAEKPERKKVKKVVKGKVMRRKRVEPNPLLDSLSIAWRHIFEEVLIPAAKDAAHDAIVKGSDTVIYGGELPKTSKSRKSRQDGASYVSYNRYASGNRPAANTPKREVSQSIRANHRIDEIILASRGEGDSVIETLHAALEHYEVVTVSDFYSAMGVEAKFTDDDWGWYDLTGAHVRRARGGFVVNLPVPVFLD